MIKNRETDDNSNSMATADDVVINNWDDWFQNCGSLVSDLQLYESLMQQYYNKQNSKKPEGQQKASQSFQQHHVSSFFEKNPLIPKWMLQQSILRTVIGFVAAFFVTVLVIMVKVALSGLSLNDYVLAVGSSMSVMTYVMLKGSLFGALAGFFVGWTTTFIHMFSIKNLCKKMKAIEVNAKGRIGYVPPKYRNSQAMGTMYDLFCNYGIVTFNQAVQACDEYLLSNNLIGAYMASMTDVPYKNNNAQNGPTNNMGNTSSDRGLYVNDAKSDDPNLPDDIFTKTFQGVEDADAKLDELIGLDVVKTQVRQMKNRMNFYNGAQTERISGNHMVFLGPPGTGKTTIARIITRILYDFGYIQENKCVEIDGGYMKSPYVGQTTERASAILRYAMGGVLFIDEAYMLMDDKSSTAGSEATGILLKAMEDNKNDFVVIFAGYEDNVNRLLSSNEGFASRIKYKVYFDNFSVEELMDIFKMQLKQYSQNSIYTLEDGVEDILAAHFDKERGVPGFGNARVVRNALDSILDNHADRFMKGDIAADKKYVIMKDDVLAYIEVRRKQMQEDGRNFIASRNLDSSIISLQELKGKTKPGAADPDKSLGNLTGLGVVKDEIAQMKAQFDFYDGKIETEGNHMVFLGPPGTGKTTVASIMTGYLYKMGIIRENLYLDINGDFLRGMYLGHTGKRTEAVVQYAQGMVLFIDEAYLLCSNGEGGSDSFGQEAVGVLLDAMEKYRKNFVVIFAGYEDEMDTFLNMNSGLRSRISLQFHFESYTPHELAQMYQRWARVNKFTVEKDVWIPFQQYLQQKVKDPRFSNGRFVRQFFEASKKQHIVNYSKQMYGDDKKYVITLQDMQPLFTSDEFLNSSDV